MPLAQKKQSATASLIQWCSNVTRQYDHVKITDMSKSFRDGLALLGIIHHFRPDLVPDFEELKPGVNHQQNCERAFELANKHFGIENFIDPEDLYNDERPDSKAVFTYVQQYYHKLAKTSPSVNKSNEKEADMDAMISNIIIKTKVTRSPFKSGKKDSVNVQIKPSQMDHSDDNSKHMNETIVQRSESEGGHWQEKSAEAMGDGVNIMSTSPESIAAPSNEDAIDDGGDKISSNRDATEEYPVFYKEATLTSQKTVTPSSSPALPWSMILMIAILCTSIILCLLHTFIFERG